MLVAAGPDTGQLPVIREPADESERGLLARDVGKVPYEIALHDMPCGTIVSEQLLVLRIVTANRVDTWRRMFET